MAETTHLMKAANNIDDKGIMSVQNSVGPGSWLLFPLTEAIGVTALDDVSASAITHPTDLTTGTKGKPVIKGASGNPTTGTVPQGITSAQSFILFGIWDCSNDATSHIFSGFTLGGLTNGMNVSPSGTISIGDGVSNSFGSNTLHETQVDKLFTATVVEAEDIAGVSTVKGYAISPNFPIYEGLSDSLTNRNTINPTNFLAYNLLAISTYCMGLIVFDGALPDTWQDDITEFYNRATTPDANGEFLNKGLPANWVTLGTPAA